MEEVGSSSICSGHDNGLSDTFRGETPSRTPVEDSEDVSYEKFSSYETSDYKIVKSRSHRTGDVVAEFRCKHFSSEKEGCPRKLLSSRSKSEAVKPICICNQIQVNKHVQGAGLPPTSRLANQNRSFRRIFSYTSCPGPSTLSSGHLCKEIVANDLPTLRLGNSSKGLCQYYELGRADSKKSLPWLATDCLSRRFFNSFSVSTAAKRAHFSCGENPAKSGMDGKLQEVCFDASEIHRIPRCYMGPVEERKEASPGEAKSSEAQNPEDVDLGRSKSATNSKFVGFMEFRQLCGSTGSPELTRPIVIRPPANEIRPGLYKNATGRGSAESSMVGTQLHVAVPSALSTSRTLPIHRFFCEGLGRTARHSDDVRSVDSRRGTSSQQCLRDASNSTSSTAKGKDLSKLQSVGSIRQPNCRGVLTQRRRLEVPAAARANVRGTFRRRSFSYPHDGLSHSRPVQLRRRSLVEIKSLSGMASAEQRSLGGVSEMGNPRYRSVCVQERARSPTLRKSRLDGPPSSVSQCLQPGLALQNGVVIPATLHNPKSVNSLEPGLRGLHSNSPRLEKGILETRPRSPSPGPSSTGERLRSSFDRHTDKLTTTASASNELTSVANSGWSSMLDAWNQSQIGVLDRSWRNSSMSSYKPAWKRWVKWSRENEVNMYQPQPQDVARFLTDLHLKYNLAYSTICVHKSVVSTFCRPILGNPLSSHIIIRQTLKGIALQQPPKRKPPIWDVKVLTAYLTSHAPHSFSLFEVSRRVAIILLLCSGRRVHDLTLLRCDSANCIIENNSIVMWPKYGSKTDNSSYRQSGWRLLACSSNTNVDPVFWVTKLLEVSQSRRGNLDSLFISTCGTPKPATPTIIGGWIKSVLKLAGIDSSPGSVRSAVASASWLDHTPIDQILSRGNWKSARTFHKFYKKEVNSSPTNSTALSNLFQSV